MRSINLIATLAATATLGLAAGADAATFCVGDHPDCPVADPGPLTLQQALDGAKQNAGPDLVLVGAGVYATPTGFKHFSATPANSVEVVGVGDATVLKADAAKKSGVFTVLEVSGDPSRVAALKVVVPDATDVAASPGGLVLRDDVLAEDVTVTDSGTATLGAKWGIRVDDAGEVRRAAIAMNANAQAVKTGQDASLLVTDSVLKAGTGVGAYSGGLATVRRSRIDAAQNGAVVQFGVMNVESTLVRITGDGGNGLQAAGFAPDSTVLNASHVTLVAAPGADDTNGVRAYTPNDGDAIAKLDNSIIHGVAHGLSRESTDADGKGEATIFSRNVNYVAANDSWAGAGSFDRLGTTTQKPAFLDPATGDYRISPTSLMVDKGRSESYAPLTGPDLAGANRSVGAKRDLGAYEYQALAPVAAIAGAGSVAQGTALALSGAGSRDDDAGDAIVGWEWSFGDGATASGKEVSHAWSQAGAYEVTLMVVDTTGRSHTAKLQVQVAGPAIAPYDDPAHVDLPVTPGGSGSGSGSGTGPGGGAQADRTPPAITALRRGSRALTFSLSEQATVRIRIQKRAGRKFRAAGAAKTLAGVAGRNKVALRRLRAGRYRAVVTATDAAGNRTVKRLAFRVR